MTMKTLRTAAAIISSAIGAGKIPVGHSTYDFSRSATQLAGAHAQLTQEFASLDRQDVPLPPEAWAKADPADSLYRRAREAWGRGDYKRAEENFHQIHVRYPQCVYARQ